jgi:hypothetical protein
MAGPGILRIVQTRCERWDIDCKDRKNVFVGDAMQVDTRVDSFVMKVKTFGFWTTEDVVELNDMIREVNAPTSN